MSSGFVRKQMGAVSRNLLLGAAALFALAGGFIWLQPPLRRLLPIQRVVPVSELQPLSQRIGELSDWPISITGTDVFDTGFQINQGRDVVGEYYGLVAGERLLLVRAEPNASRLTYKGTLVPLPAMEMTEVTAKVEREMNRSNAFFPLLLDAAPPTLKEWVGSGMVALLLLGLGAVTAVASVRKLLRGMPKGVRPEDREATVDRLEMEIESEVQSNAMKIGPATVTSSWLLVSYWFDFYTIRLDDLLWMHRTMISHQQYAITVAKSHSVTVWSRHHKRLDIRVKNQELADQLIALISSRVPWMPVGFNENLDELFRKNFPSAVQSIDELRAKHAA